MWVAGSDVTLVGMPKVEMEAPSPRGFPYWTPKPTSTATFSGKYCEEAGTPSIISPVYSAYDFSPGGKDAGAYPSSVGRTPKYGPSSGHPTVVNHLFGDGEVRSLTRDVDYAMYFFAITRRNDDPAPNFD
jgi:hypothetical protein